MKNQKTVSPTPSPSATLEKDVTPETPEVKSPVQEWEFKIRGRGTSGWMSYVKEDGEWAPLRPSDTSFLSAVTAIEPEVLRKAFPHTTGKP